MNTRLSRRRDCRPARDSHGHGANLGCAPLMAGGAARLLVRVGCGWSLGLWTGGGNMGVYSRPIGAERRRPSSHRSSIFNPSCSSITYLSRDSVAFRVAGHIRVAFQGVELRTAFRLHAVLCFLYLCCERGKKDAFEHSEDPSTRLSTWGLRNALGYGEKSWHQSSQDPGGQPARLGSGRLGGTSKAARGPSPAAAAERRPIRPPLFKLSPSRLSRRRDTSQCGSCAAGGTNYCCSVFGKAGGC